MKAKVIETGEVVNVTSNPTWYKENGQGPDRREWDEDELEFIPNPNAPKLVSLDKVCEWIEDNVDERYIHFTLDGCKDPEIEYYRIIEDLKRAMEE